MRQRKITAKIKALIASTTILLFAFQASAASASPGEHWLIPEQLPSYCAPSKVENAVLQNATENAKFSLVSASGSREITASALAFNLTSNKVQQSKQSTTTLLGPTTILNVFIKEQTEQANGNHSSHTLNILVGEGTQNERDLIEAMANTSAQPLVFWLLAPRNHSGGHSSAIVKYLNCAETVSQQAEAGRIQLADIAPIIAKTLGIPENVLDTDTDLRQLGADEYKLFEMLQIALEKFGLQAQPEDSIGKVSNILKYLNEQPRLRGNNKPEEAQLQTVFYGTNRKRADSATAIQYGGERNPSGNNEYGLCRVSIPLTHSKGKLESPFLGIKLFQDPAKHVLLREVQPLSSNAFYKLTAQPHMKDDMVIFVHGFNVSFEAAATRTAQIAFDIGFEGTPVFFSWPSDASMFAYTRDREDANWSRGHLERFLTELLARTAQRKIHLIAHSMGNQVLIGALHQMALRNPTIGERFASVIFAAPDFDAELFAQQIAPEVVGMSKNWTIYTSDKDSALTISQTVNSARRLGQPVQPIADMTVIDATGIEVTPWKVPEFHSYYATKQKVVDDIIAVITGKPFADRSLKASTKDQLEYWQLRE